MSKIKYEVLARRYRPQTFSDVVGQEAIVTTLKNALRFDKIAHAYLFCGSRGVGKTTLARLFAKALNCENRTAELEPCNECSSCKEITGGQSLDVIEIDGASNRGIDDIRQINETIVYAPSQGHFKIYIIDEVHMLTKEAFNALLKTLEEPPEKVKFFFATTEPHKVLPTIISRCQRFDLGRIQLSQMTSKLEEITKDLGRTVEAGALHLIASFSEGSLRDAESLLDQILCFAEGTVTTHEIRDALGLISQNHFFELDKAFSEVKTVYAFELVSSLFSTGKNLAHFYEQLIEHVRLITLAKTIGEKALELPPDTASHYLESSRLYTTAQCLYLLDYLLKGEQQIQKSSSPRVSLEAALLHYIQSKNRIPVEILVRKLAELEDAIKRKEPQICQEIDRHEPLTQEPTVNLEQVPLHVPEIANHSSPNDPILKKETENMAHPMIEVNEIKNCELVTKIPETPSSETKVSIDEKNWEEQSAQIKIDSLACLDLELKSPKPLVHTPTDFFSKPSAPPQKKVEPKAEPSPIIKNTSSSLHPSHYDTLIRFAAVELEGTVKKTT